MNVSVYIYIHMWYKYIYIYVCRRVLRRSQQAEREKRETELPKRIHVLRTEATVAGGTLTDSEPG